MLSVGQHLPDCGSVHGKQAALNGGPDHFEHCQTRDGREQKDCVAKKNSGFTCAQLQEPDSSFLLEQPAEKGGNIMAANTTIVNSNLIPDAQQIVLEPCELTATGLLQRMEVLLRKAFGDDEVIMASSLRGL
jgi:hypothetical protein